MSRRTSESNKAIAQAWEKEKKRVSEGYGTRDWTPEQQKNILECGKAYDDSGKAFEGQHMRSAEMHPECQGDPNNIQFLTREEHLDAHDGNWKNPTNWYYDPVTKAKTDFSNGPIIPCKVIKLSNPIVIPEITQVDEGPVKEELESSQEEPIEKPMEDKLPNEENTNNGKSVLKIPYSEQAKKIAGAGILNTLKKGAKTVGKFLMNHKSEIITGVVAIGGTILKTYADSNGSYSGNDDSDIGSDGGYSSSEDHDYSNSYEDADSYDLTSNDCYSEDSGHNYSSERSSPREHDVSGYTRHQNGKEIHVNPYKRGGKKHDN